MIKLVKLLLHINVLLVLRRNISLSKFLPLSLFLFLWWLHKTPPCGFVDSTFTPVSFITISKKNLHTPHFGCPVAFFS